MILRDPYYNPTIAIHPGESLRDELEFLRVSQKELSLRTGISTKHISQIIHGEAPITMETAMKLERALSGTPPASFWINHQKSYEFHTARLVEEKKLKNEVENAKKYTCYAELVRLSAVRNVSTWIEKAEELLKFFRVDSLTFIPSVYGVVAYRRSKGDFDQHSLFAWLQCGEHQSRTLELQEFSEKKLRENLLEMKKLIRNDGEFFTILQKLCADAGVALVYTPYFSKTKVNGAVRWIGEHPLIQLNSRGTYRDGFWFTFLHEIGHVLLHGKKDLFVDYGNEKTDEKEKQADKFAADFLIEPSEYAKILSQKEMTVKEAEDFAKSVDVDVSILVGRFAHDNLVSWKTRSKLCKKISLPEPSLNLVS